MNFSLEVENCITNSIFMYDEHFNERIVERDLEDINIVQALLTGEIIESFKRFNNGEKYIVHCCFNKKMFHIILIYNHETLLLKTIYTPDILHFEPDLKTRLNGDLFR